MDYMSQGASHGEHYERKFFATIHPNSLNMVTLVHQVNYIQAHGKMEDSHYVSAR